MQQDPPTNLPTKDILNTKPAAILEGILHADLAPEVQINRLANALINTHTEATSRVRQLEQALSDMAITMAQIQAKIESNNESNQTRDLTSHYE